MTQQVNFKVLDIRKAEHANGCMVVQVMFDNNTKVYTYVRKNKGNAVDIDGCKVQFSLDNNGVYQVRKIYRFEETKGHKHADTSNLMKRKNKKSTETPKTVIEAVKEDIVDQNLEDQVKAAEEAIKAVKDEATKVLTPEIPKGPVHHEKYDQIKACIDASIPVYLAGPAGSGKNHTVEQIAKELDMNFYFSNSIQQEYKLTGFIDAGGKFHETEFYKACTDENECVFFLDEMDASIPEVLVLMNAAIANGYFEFPNGRVDFDHVHFVAAGNTLGSGSDEMYTGRMVIDQATLDRFAIIEFDYSIKIERKITKGNEELISFIHELRNEATQKGIRATFSYRCMIMTTKLEKSGMDLQDIMKIAIVKGLDKDTISTLNPIGHTKYHWALNKVKQEAA